MKKKQVVTAKAKENLAQFKGGKLINFKRNLVSPEICGHTFMVCLNKNNSIYNIVEITKEGDIIGRYKDLFNIVSGRQFSEAVIDRITDYVQRQEYGNTLLDQQDRCD